MYIKTGVKSERDQTPYPDDPDFFSVCPARPASCSLSEFKAERGNLSLFSWIIQRRLWVFEYLVSVSAKCLLLDRRNDHRIFLPDGFLWSRHFSVHFHELESALLSGRISSMPVQSVFFQPQEVSAWPVS